MTTAPRFKYDHSTDQRDCALYLVYVLHPTTGQIVLGYVGETARTSFIRFMEHLYDQPWGDTIVGMPRVDPRVFTSKAAVWEAEREAVERLLPLYNSEWQPPHNPNRIWPDVAKRQRAARDEAQGVTSRWTLQGDSNPAYGPTPARSSMPRTAYVPSVPQWKSTVRRIGLALLRSHRTYWTVTWALSWWVLAWLVSRPGVHASADVASTAPVPAGVWSYGPPLVALAAVVWLWRAQWRRRLWRTVRRMVR